MKSIFYVVLVALGFMISGCSTTTFKMFDDNNTAIKNVAENDYAEEVQFEWKITKGDRIEIIVATQSTGDGNQELNVLLNTAGRMNFGYFTDPDFNADHRYYRVSGQSGLSGTGIVYPRSIRAGWENISCV